MKKKSLSIVLLSLLLVSCNDETSIYLTDKQTSESVSESVSESILTEKKHLEISSTKENLFVGEEYTLPINDVSIILSSKNENIEILDNNKAIIKAVKEGIGSIVISLSDSTESQTISFNILSNSETVSYTYYDLDKKNKYNTIETSGDLKVLVLPIKIKDYANSASDTNLNRIKQAFNGGEDVKWESVSSFYRKSSYNNLNLDFVVADQWYDSNYTTSEVSSLVDGYGGATTIIDNALSWYKETYNDDLTSFDHDKDGFVDAIWAIYSAPDYSINSKVGTNFWAFTGYNVNNSTGNLTSPVSKGFSWASYDFMDNYSSSDYVDTHTYIHETGHLLGLADYYCYSSSSLINCSPTGCIDMMDLNIGDHCAFSKFALGWIKPKIVEETTTITLKPFEENGDFILLSSSSYNKTAFDEYFTIEYITPTNLNEQDYTNVYTNNNMQGYSKNGIRIMHVDSRCRTEDSNWNFASNYQDYYDIALSNTYTRYSKVYSDSNPMYLLTLMQNNIKKNYKKSVISDNDAYYSAIKGGENKALDPNESLFHEGDTFSLSDDSEFCYLMPSKSNKLNKYSYTYNKEDKFNYSIKVISLSDEEAKLEITRLEQ